MVVLFSINKKGIHHLIEIGQEFVLRDDDFISIEIGNMDWFKHAQKCIDCGALLKTIQNPKSAFKWYLKSENEIFILNLGEFAREDHFKNLAKNVNSNNFFGAKLKFRKENDTKVNLEKLRIEKENEGKYMQCAELRDAKIIAERQ